MMETEVQIDPLNPWVSIWIRPRETIRWIVETDPTRQVILLAALSGIAQSLARASERSLGDIISVPIIFIIALIAGSIGGILSLYIGGALLRWTGSWFGGQAASEEVRAAIAWSSVPIIWSLLLLIPELALFGEELFTSATPRIDANPLLQFLLLGFVAVEIVISIWAFVLFLKCLGEVHRFSAWKALGAVVIPGLVLVGIVFACVFGIMLVS
jgi:hypothetical protein